MARRIEVQILGDASQLQRTFSRASKSASVFNRDLSHASRGALAGSGVFRSLGRSIAFASGGFLAFATAGQFLRTSLDAAKDAGVTQKQLAAQFRASGLSLKDYRAQIDKTNMRLSATAGINKNQLDQSFTTIFRSTNNVGKALKDEAVAADIAAGRHISLATASVAVGKAAAGSTTSLKRLGIELPKGTTGVQAIAIAAERFKGQAAAAATEQQKFGAILHNSEVIIGNGLLPVLNKYLGEGAAWLQQMNESGKLQKDISKITKDLTAVIHGAADVVKIIHSAFTRLDSVTGSLTNTLKAFAGIWLLIKARTALIRWGVIESGIAGTGDAALIADGKVAALSTRLGALSDLAPIAIPIVLLTSTKQGQDISQQDTSALHDVITDKHVNKKFFGDLGRLVFGGKPKGGLLGGLFGAGSGSNPPAFNGAPKFPLAPFRPGLDKTQGRSAGSGGGGLVGGTSLVGQFNLDELKLADAQRLDSTKLQRQILVSEETIVMRLRDQAKNLKDRTQYAQQAASIEDQIRSLNQQGVTKAQKQKKAVAAKLSAGGVPMALQLAQAKADAIAAGLNTTDLTRGQIKAAEAIRTAEMKAIRSHKLSMQGLIDAWTQIGSINSELQGQGKKMASTYHAVSTSALTKGLGLSHDTAVAIRERAAQRDAHGGMAPNGPAVLGQTIVLNNPVFNGIRNVDQLAAELNKRTKSRHQRRGTRR